MMSKTRTQKGREAENLAVSYLEAKGWIVLDQNYFFQRSEVDIVAFNQKKIVFVEVRAKSNTYFGRPEESIDTDKKKNIFKAAEAWLYERKMEGALVRFDVIAIVAPEKGAPEITHIEDAFR